MKNAKLKIIFLFVIIILVIFNSIVLAYYVSKNETEMKYSLGFNTITLKDEPNIITDLKKGDVITKNVNIQNTGNTSCYVRIKTVLQNSEISNKLEIEFNTKKYFYNKNDGYWYYREVLEPEQKTENLYSTIKISDTFDTYTLNTFTIYTFAESVQVAKCENFEPDLERSWGINKVSEIEMTKFNLVEDSKTDTQIQNELENLKYSNFGRLSDSILSKKVFELKAVESNILDEIGIKSESSEQVEENSLKEKDNNKKDEIEKEKIETEEVEKEEIKKEESKSEQIEENQSKPDEEQEENKPDSNEPEAENEVL